LSKRGGELLKNLLYLAAFIFVVLLIMGNTTALLIFFGATFILSIGYAIIEKFEKKKS
jgi:hypothetical protein